MSETGSRYAIAPPVPCTRRGRTSPLTLAPESLLTLALASLLLLAPASRAEEAAPPEPTGAQASAEEVVGPGDWVWIDFALWEENGTLLNTTTHSEPLRLRHGQGTVPPAVEQAMLGMTIDEHKTVRIPMDSADAFADAERFENVALDSIPESTREVGHPIVKEEPSGEKRAGRVHEIKGDRAVIDWRPLAGQTLTFDFRIVEIHVPAVED